MYLYSLIIVIITLLVVFCLGVFILIRQTNKLLNEREYKVPINNYGHRQNGIIGRYYVSPTDMNRMYRLESITPNYTTQRDSYNLVDDDCMGERIQVSQASFNHWILVPQN